jgi:hypothetical protein
MFFCVLSLKCTRINSTIWSKGGGGGATTPWQKQAELASSSVTNFRLAQEEKKALYPEPFDPQPIFQREKDRSMP